MTTMEKEKARKPISLPSLNTLLLVGFVFHLIFIYSVFDCYFTSPVVHGMQAFNVSVNDKRLSKRVVLISADGLRADLLLESNGFRGALPSNDTEGIDVVAPYLHSIISNRGAYGVSHTRVPTESRPGHVAIIAGMYEDVSAVTKGWKVNPVEFDSVFNRSSGTWAFGSPDIVPMFTKSAQGRVREWCYDESEEDFTKDATALDFWVLERLRELLRDDSFSESLHQSGVVFFLHLLGLDTTGHSYRPFSREYMHNIQVVDRIVREVEAMIEEFYGHDGDTSFVFTADHGMSVIGNHGDGHPDNTRTPYIVWGKGLRGPLADTGFSSHDAYSEGWEFRSSSNELLYRRDIDQADLAPLMTALLGINWPVNSVGIVPVDLLNPFEINGVASKVRGDGNKQDGEWFKAQVKFVNAKVILEQYRVKHQLKQTHKLFYTPFPSLSGDRYIRELDMLEEYIFSNSSEFSIHEKVNHHAERLIADALAGLHYLQTYERTLIRAMVSMAYTGWAAWAGSRVFFPLSSKRVGSHNIATVAIQFLSLTVLFGMSGMFWMEHAPWTYYLYLGFPVFFWNRVISTLVTTITANPLHVSDLLRLNRGTIFKTVRNALLVGCALSCMVLGYTHRSIWSIGFIIIGVAWPLLQWDVVSRRSLGQKTWWWTVSCLIAAVFPLLKVNKEENLGNIILGGLAALLVGGIILREIVILVPHHSDKKVVLVLVGVQSLLILIALLVTRSSVLSLQAKEGLPKWCQATGWSVLIISLLVTFLPVLSIDATAPAAKQVLYLRYLLGLTPLFIILSLSDETLFFVSYTFVMGLWAEVERVVSRPRIVAGDVNGTRSGEEILSIYRFKADDLRIALFFLFFVQIAFFGTGNVASVSSFYLSPVYRLVPVFNPFFMSGLLVCKIITPYVILAIATAAVTHSLGLPPFSLFLVALCVTDGMTLIFFFNVTDTGSWLEIGQTISFFVITSLLTLWSGGICVLGEWLTRDVLRGKGEEAMSRGKSKTQ